MLKPILVTPDIISALDELAAISKDPKTKIIEDALALYMEYKLQSPLGFPLSTEQAIQEIIRYFCTVYNSQVSRCC